MGRIKRWSGGKWNDYNNMKRWDGKKWVKANVKRYNASSKKWEVISEQKKTKTWTATWSQSYGSNNKKKPAYADKGRLYQGRYGNPDSIWYGNPWYIQRSLTGFPGGMFTELKGARIQKIEVYLHIEWAWYWAGAIANVGVHNYKSIPKKFGYERYGVSSVRYTSRSQGKWINLTSVKGLFEQGKAKGIVLYKNSTNVLYYGYWNGMDGNSKTKPKIRATYYK